jgi:hypothetical protein
MIFGKKTTFKIDKVINDFISSNDNVKNYTTNISFDNITTSYSNWDINYSQGYVEISSTLLTKPDNNFTKLLSNYDSYYDKIYSNKRKLIWLLQYGEVNVTFLNSIELKLLPIQLLVLEIFEYTDLVKLDKIKESSFFNNYSIKFRDSIINSLIIGGLLILTDNQLKLSNCVNIATNYIDIFINNSDKESVFIDTKAEIAHNREDIIKSIINHYLKISAKNKLELYDLVSRNIKLFELNEELFIKSINSLIKFDYIKYENNLYTKLVY